MSLKYIACRLGGAIVREETLDGRRHFVVPFVGMVEGVHQGIIAPGQPGPRSFYSFAEISAGADTLSGQATTLYHPMNATELVPANSPEGESFIIGRVSNVSAENQRLRGEAWIDAARAPQRLIEMLQNGEQIDVSLGIMGDATATTGVWNGETYDEVVTNIRFDHLALLPGASGACSWEDGCGVRANQKIILPISKEPAMPMPRKWSFLRAMLGAKSPDTKETRINALFSDKGNDFTEEDRAFLMSLDDKALWIVANELSHDEVSQQLWDFVNSLDSTEFYNYLKEVYDDYFIYRTSRRNNMTGSTTSTSMYKRGFSVDATTNKVVVADGPIEVVEKTEYVPVASTTANVTIHQESVMKTKEDLIKDLIACDRTPFKEEDRPMLMGLTECKLNEWAERLKPPAAVAPTTVAAAPVAAAPAAPAPIAEAPKPQTMEQFLATAPKEVSDVVRGMMTREQQAKDGLIEKIVANQGCLFTKEELKLKDLTELGKLAGSIGIKAETVADYTGQVGSAPTSQDNFGAYSVPDIPTEVPAVAAAEKK